MTGPSVGCAPSLLTPRLRLRALTPGEGARLAVLAGAREIAATTLRIPHPYTPGDAENFIALCARQWAEENCGTLGVTLRESGLLVGCAGLYGVTEHGHRELGYWIGVEHWGRGYASEAARAMVRFAFEHLGLNRVFAFHMGRNPASGRVLVNAGMRPEGVQRQHVLKWGVYEDSVLYGVLRSDPSPARELSSFSIEWPG